MIGIALAWLWLLVIIGIAACIAISKGWEKAGGVLISTLIVLATLPAPVILILATVDVLIGLEVTP